MSAELIELSNALAETTASAAANVVAVHAEARGSASGVIWRPGIVATAEHALRRDEEIHATLPDGRVVPATLVGRDPSTDLAVLKCAEVTAAVPTFGDATALKAGSLTLVVGRTRASGPVAALGVVSLVAAERRTWTGAALTPYVRLDVGLQPTAIGGAVVDAQGRTVGIATPRFARFGAIAIPARAVDRVVDTLLKKGHIPQGYLGVGLQSVRCRMHSANPSGTPRRPRPSFLKSSRKARRIRPASLSGTFSSPSPAIPSRALRMSTRSSMAKPSASRSHSNSSAGAQRKK